MTAAYTRRVEPFVPVLRRDEHGRLIVVVVDRQGREHARTGPVETDPNSRRTRDVCAWLRDLVPPARVRWLLTLAALRRSA